MSFEMMLAQLMNLPVKFLLSDSIKILDGFKDKPEAETKDALKEEKFKVIQRFDKQLKDIKIPKILLERLAKEFNDTHKMS
jgi:hypothetical protein